MFFENVYEFVLWCVEIFFVGVGWGIILFCIFGKFIKFFWEYLWNFVVGVFNYIVFFCFKYVLLSFYVECLSCCGVYLLDV